MKVGVLFLQHFERGDGESVHISSPDLAKSFPRLFGVRLNKVEVFNSNGRCNRLRLTRLKIHGMVLYDAARRRIEKLIFQNPCAFNGK